MSVPRLIGRHRPRDGGQQDEGAGLEPGEARILQEAESPGPGRLHSKGIRVGAQGQQRMCDPVRGVCKERDLAIGVGPEFERPQHARSAARQIVGKRCRSGTDRSVGRGGPREVQEVEHALEQQRVIHRTAFDMASVGPDLPIELAPERIRMAEPRVPIRPLEEESGKHHTEPIREQVVGLEASLGVARQSLGLTRQRVANPLARGGVQLERPGREQQLPP